MALNTSESIKGENLEASFIETKSKHLTGGKNEVGGE